MLPNFENVVHLMNLILPRAGGEQEGTEAPPAKTLKKAVLRLKTMFLAFSFFRVASFSILLWMNRVVVWSM